MVEQNKLPLTPNYFLLKEDEINLIIAVNIKDLDDLADAWEKQHLEEIEMEILLAKKLKLELGE